MVVDLLPYIQQTIVHYINCINTESIIGAAPTATVATTTSTTTTSAAANLNSSTGSTITNSFPNNNNKNNLLATNKMPENAEYNGGGGSSSNKNPSIVLNVEKFIRDVEDRPAIWNRNYHCNKLFMEQTWDELSAIHKLPKQTLKTKWKGLRDNFRVEYKRIPRNENGEFLIPPEAHDSKWTHYQSLLFLTEHMRHRAPKTDNISLLNYNSGLPFCYQSSINDDQVYEQNIVEPDLTNGLIQLPDDDDNDDCDNVDGDGITGNPNNNKTPSVTLIPMLSKVIDHHNKHNAAIHRSNESNSNDSAIYSSSGNGSCSGGSMNGSRHNTHIPIVTLKRKRISEEDEQRYPTQTTDMKPNLDQLNEQSDPDDDYHYLLSLHPYMKQLSPAQKLRLRTKIQKLIFKELYKEDIEEVKQ